MSLTLYIASAFATYSGANYRRNSDKNVCFFLNVSYINCLLTDLVNFIRKR